MELLDRKIVRIPLYGLFTLVVFLAALVLTFPDERVKQIVIVQAEQALNAGKRADAGDRIWEVRIDDLIRLELVDAFERDEPAKNIARRPPLGQTSFAAPSASHTRSWPPMSASHLSLR